MILSCLHLYHFWYNNEVVNSCKKPARFQVSEKAAEEEVTRQLDVIPRAHSSAFVESGTTESVQAASSSGSIDQGGFASR